MVTSDIRVVDHLGAFRTIFDHPIRGRPDSPICGRSFAAKDLFDVKGYVTGCGNPDWERTHTPALCTASAVEALVDAGAVLIGKTHTDELAYSLNGENAHFGTPVNARAPGRIPGGSSSGSAAAVAGACVDFALGTDTGGSVRLPASYCGLYGIRPTHGSISLDGCVPLAPSFDTAGWFARTPGLLLDIGRVLLRSSIARAAHRDMIVARSVFELCDPAVRSALEQALERLSARTAIRTVSWTGDLASWSNTFRTLQAFEAWQVHGQWITRVHPRFGHGIQERFTSASSVTAEDYKAAQSNRDTIRRQLVDLLAPGTTLLWPTAPCIALPKGMSQEALDPVRRRILCLTCVAGLGGLPQVTVPAGSVDGCPVGLSLLGAAGQDLALLELAGDLVGLLGEENG